MNTNYGPDYSKETKNSYNITHNNTALIHCEKDSQEISEWKNRLHAILKDVPSKANAIKPVIQFLVAAISPVKIYQINHHDTPGIHLSKYIDLIIIISDENEGSFAEMEPILNIAYVQDQRVSCSLHKESKVLGALKTGHIFYSLFCVSENLIYDNKSENYIESSTEALRQMKDELYLQFVDSYKKARSFYDCAIFLQQDKTCKITIFMLHQTVEFIYRIVVKTLNGYDKTTHEIRCLQKHARRCAPQLNTIFPDDTEEESRILGLLEAAYFNARYEDVFNVTNEDMLILSERVKLLLDTGKKVVEIKLKNE